ncbi:ATP-binding cassette domain-containing protein, partial [Escherichia coli]
TDLFIDENERVCLVGRNGAGKSTLLRVLAKEQPLDDGQVVYEQDLVTARLQQDPPRDIEGTIFDFVAQGVAEDAQYITEYHRVSK